MKSHPIVSTIEYLKHFTGIVIDAFHEGEGFENTPITLEVAKGLIWNETHRAVLKAWNDDIGSVDCSTLWLRISSSSSGKAMAALEKYAAKNVATARCLGPRKDGAQTVVYAVVFADNFAHANAIIEGIEGESDCDVRDWSYGVYGV